jgi:site-specific recombinase XerD
VELPHVVAHDLRHFFAPALIADGAGVRQVAVLGHATAVITLWIYAHLWPGEDDRTRFVMHSVLAAMRTGCGQATTENGVVAGQAA